ncbi:MAG TPA: cation transporter, partial [Chitinophagaceae bacterium]|nr:cation transporter [Chitinophagaceae bacterium]
METVKWKVEGMDCSNCALTIRKYLEKEGMNDIKVNFATGDLSFEMNGQTNQQELVKGISQLGYQVAGTGLAPENETKKPILSTHFHRFLFCLPFAVILMLHMIPGLRIHWLMDPWVQLCICIPVYIVGMQFFGRSAWKSLRNGLPNMNVLIAIGSTAAFVYSLYGTITGQGGHYLFYETAATIITL